MLIHYSPPLVSPLSGIQWYSRGRGGRANRAWRAAKALFLQTIINKKTSADSRSSAAAWKKNRGEEGLPWPLALRCSGSWLPRAGSLADKSPTVPSFSQAAVLSTGCDLRGGLIGFDLGALPGLPRAYSPLKNHTWGLNLRGPVPGKCPAWWTCSCNPHFCVCYVQT